MPQVKGSTRCDASAFALKREDPNVQVAAWTGREALVGFRDPSGMKSAGRPNRNRRGDGLQKISKAVAVRGTLDIGILKTRGVPESIISGLKGVMKTKCFKHWKAGTPCSSDTPMPGLPECAATNQLVTIGDKGRCWSGSARTYSTGMVACFGVSCALATGFQLKRESTIGTKGRA